MWPYNSVLGGIDEFRQSRLGFDILNGIDTAKLYPYTGSKKVSGRKGEEDFIAGHHCNQILCVR